MAKWRLKGNFKKKPKVLRDILSYTLLTEVDGYLDCKVAVSQVREFKGGLLLQFVDGVVNTLYLAPDGPVWKENEPSGRLFAENPLLKKHLKKIIRKGFYCNNVK